MGDGGCGEAVFGAWNAGAAIATQKVEAAWEAGCAAASATVLVACCHGSFNGMHVWVLAGDLKVAMVVRVFVTGGGVGKFSEWRGVEVEVMTWKVTVWNRRLRISLIR